MGVLLLVRLSFTAGTSLTFPFPYYRGMGHLVLLRARAPLNGDVVPISGFLGPDGIVSGTLYRGGLTVLS